jgi:membrane AbrB-like protein
VPFLEAPLTWHLWLVGTAVAGVFIGRKLRFPAAFLLGPFVVSAGVHALGVSTFRPSTEIVNFAQIVLGSLVGSAFVGTPVRRVLAVITLSIGSTVILLSVTLVAAFGVSSLTDYDLVPLILAYSPGGLPEMSLIAVALQIEAAFVAAHHAARILMVAFGASPIFRLLGWQERPRA